MAMSDNAQRDHWSWGAKFLLVLVLVTACVLSWQAMQPWLQRPLQQIILQTNIPAAEKAALQTQLNDHLADSFFGADLQAIQQEVQHHPWVSDVKVSRIWPNRLMVEAAEQIFIARWQKGGFINNKGELVLVEPGQVKGFSRLPILGGLEGSAWIMSQLYRQMSWLVGRDDLTIVQLTMTHRGAVELYLHNGIVLVLGREQVLPRLQRLMKIYHRHLAAKAITIKRIDGRYPHGVSVVWKGAGS
jgi:cell division protein FtsQ